MYDLPLMSKVVGEMTSVFVEVFEVLSGTNLSNWLYIAGI